jgi:Dihydrodipicolinate synthetase family
VLGRVGSYSKIQMAKQGWRRPRRNDLPATQCGHTRFGDVSRYLHHGPACERQVSVTRHGEGNMARYDRINQLRRLQAEILRCGGDSIGSQQGVDASLRAPQDRYRTIYEESGLPLILFQYPDATKATCNLETQLDIAALPGVFAMKNGVRNMRRWDTEIPVVRRERPNLQLLTCHDEYLLHTMFDVDGALVGYGGLTPEPLIELIAAGKAKDYAKARAIHDRLLPVTRTVYHRESHMEGTVALKHGLVARGILEHATVRSPLLPLEPGADVEIANALHSAGLIGQTPTRSRAA